MALVMLKDNTSLKSEDSYLLDKLIDLVLENETSKSKEIQDEIIDLFIMYNFKSYDQDFIRYCKCNVIQRKKILSKVNDLICKGVS